MVLRFAYFLALLITTNYTLSQSITNNRVELSDSVTHVKFPDSTHMKSYYDSLKQVFKCDLLTGYTFSDFNEIVSDIHLLYQTDNSGQKLIIPDRYGRFYIIPDSTFSSTIHLTSKSNNFRLIDTNITWSNYLTTPLVLKFIPHYKINIRGRIYAGSLPLENANVEIIHNSDTFHTKTLECYFDNENYWNCLYLGMFRQTIAFDVPDDSIFISVWKDGFRKSNLQLRCSSYDGTILPVKLKYSSMLPKLYRNNINLKLSPPFFKNWMVSINYTHLLNINGFKRLGIGIESSMLISTITTDHKTFRDINNLPDTTYLISETDSSYMSAMISPQLLFHLNNPQRRYFGIYSGIAFPYILNEQRVYIHPFIGTYWYLDLNKALLVECRYAAYSFDVVNFTFNPYGDAYRYKVSESFWTIIVNLGLQISF